MLLKELFWYHNLYFDYDPNLTFDDIVINIDQDIINELPDLITKIRSQYSNFSMNLYISHKNIDIQEVEKVIYSIGIYLFYHMTEESFYTIHI
jgi:hypothetical protein